MYRPESDRTEINKKEAYERLCEGAPDAFYLLSGVSERTSLKDGEKSYRPGSYADVDWKGLASGGKARALAMAELANYFPTAEIAVNSNTFNVHDPEAPTDAVVMAEYVERKGVESGRILEQDRSTTTFTELIELYKYIRERQWSHVVVVAGEFQIPRTAEMLKQLNTLRDPAGAWADPEFQEALKYVAAMHPKVTLISAESVLPLRDPRYADLIAKARASEGWIKRVQSEEGAVKQLERGEYWKAK